MFRRTPKHEDSTPNEGPAGTPQGDTPAGAGSDAAELAAALQATLAERDEANQKYLRVLADFQNFQRRSIENEREARRQGLTAVLHSIIPIVDHFDLALAHTNAEPAAQGVIAGVRVIREELLKALGQHGVSLINPAPGDELDPNRHQALMTQPAGNVAPGRIAFTMQIGYLLGERVIRPAKVAVTPQQDAEPST